jgi:hypothetical protein
VDPTTNRDDVLLILPLVALLVFGYFRVDEIFGHKKPPATHPVPPAKPVADPADASLMTDPDGRHWS